MWHSEEKVPVGSLTLDLAEDLSQIYNVLLTIMHGETTAFYLHFVDS